MTANEATTDITDITAEAEAAYAASGTVRVAAAEFRRIVSAVLPSVARDDSRPALTYVGLEIVPDEIMVMAVNGFSASRAAAPCEGSLTCGGAVQGRCLREVERLTKTLRATMVAITPGAPGGLWRFALLGDKGAALLALEAPSLLDIPDGLATLPKQFPAPGTHTVALSPHLLRSILAVAPDDGWPGLAKFQISAPDKAVLITLQHPSGTPHSEHVLMPMVQQSYDVEVAR